MDNRNVCIRVQANDQQIEACKYKLHSQAQSLGNLAKIFALAGNEVRLKILYLIYFEKELCVCDLSDILSMSISAVSQHLRKLKDQQLIDLRKEGQTYYYFIQKDYFPFLEKFWTMLEGVVK